MIRKILSLFFIAFIFFLISKIVNFREIINLFNKSNYLILLLGFILTLIWPILASFRWSFTLKSFEIKTSYLNILNSVMISFSTTLFAPAKAGDFVKMFVMGKEFKKIDLASAVISERIADLYVLFIFSLIGSVYIQNKIFIFTSSILIFLLTTTVFIFGRIDIKFKFNINIINKLLYVAMTSSSRWFSSFTDMKYVILFSFINWLLAITQIYIFFQAFGAELNYFHVLAIFPLTVLLTLIPITPGGIGVREASFAFLFYSYADTSINIAVSLCYFICASCITTIIGAMFNMLNSFSRKE